MQIKGKRLYVNCCEKTCSDPVATVENGVLVIKQRHHGEWHTNVLRLDDLYELLREHGRLVYTKPNDCATIPDDSYVT